jgi:ubiquinone/menaquinone biosynthesis C-methylase UbiE
MRMGAEANMDLSLQSWDTVWQNTHEGYALVDSRFERADDKLKTFILNGVRFQKGEKVLEAGCGDGSIAISLAKRFQVQSVGVDFSKNAAAQAKTLMKEKGIEFECVLSDVRQMPFADNSFDKVISLGVIEHMQDPPKAVHELFRVLKPEGQMILMTPNKRSFGVYDRKFKQLMGLWKFGHQDEYTPCELEHFARIAGFDRIEKVVVGRQSLKKDNFTFRWISRTDAIVRVFSKNWGFYSYIFAQKRSGV